MSLETAIVIASMWVFTGMVSISKWTTSKMLWLAFIVSLAFSIHLFW